MLFQPTYKRDKTRSRFHNSGLTTRIKREERIADIRETIKVNESLISYYTRLADSAPENHLSFAAYKVILDKEQAELTKRYDDLQQDYSKASNGHIQSLRQQNDELAAKLFELKDDTPAKKEAEARSWDKKRDKAKYLGYRIRELEQQLCDENFDVEELLRDL